jgi:hypothetical protein
MSNYHFHGVVQEIADSQKKFQMCIKMNFVTKLTITLL